jgi:Zn-dependent protease with chaperone function
MQPLMPSIPLTETILPGEKAARWIVFGMLAALWLAAPLTGGTTLAMFGAIALSFTANAIFVLLRVAWLRAHAVPITPESHPRLAAVEAHSARALGLQRGIDYELYTVMDPAPNAYAIGFIRPFVVVITSSALELIAQDDGALAFVLGHELLHCARLDPRSAVVTGSLSGAAIKWLRLVGLPAQAAFALFDQYLEGAADRAGYVVAGDFSTAAETLVRLSSYGKLAETINYVALVSTARKNSSSLWGRISESFSSHPSLGGRIYALAQWVESDQFAALVGAETAERERETLTGLGLTGLECVDSEDGTDV